MKAHSGAFQSIQVRPGPFRCIPVHSCYYTHRLWYGAAGIWAHDLPLRKRTLYQLSYWGSFIYQIYWLNISLKNVYVETWLFRIACKMFRQSASHGCRLPYNRKI